MEASVIPVIHVGCYDSLVPPVTGAISSKVVDETDNQEFKLYRDIEIPFLSKLILAYTF